MSTNDRASHEDQSKSLLIAKIYYQGHLKSAEAQDYLAFRGLSAQSCRRFEIGYAPDKWRGLTDHFSSHRMRLAAKDAGVITERQTSAKMLDVFRGRLMFPIHNDNRAIIGYGGRLLPQFESAPDADFKQAKYINTRETDQFDKSKILYGLHQNRGNIHHTKSAIVVEGYMDVVCMDSAGISNAVAPMGTSLTASHMQKLQSEGVRSIYLCFDGDNAGQNAALRSALIATANIMPTTEVFIINLPDGHDPDTFIRQYGAGAFNELTTNAATLPQFVSDNCMASNMQSLEGQAAYLANLEPFIADSSTVTRNAILDIAQQVTSLPAEHLYEGKYHDATAGKLCQLTAQWSRMLVHGQISPEQTLQYSASGTFNTEDIHSLAHEISDKPAQRSELHDFALTHGPLSPAEADSVKAEIETTIGIQNFTNALERLQQMPFDSSAKREIKSMMRFG